MATTAIYPLPLHEAPLFPQDDPTADILAQRFINYVWKHYHYVLTHCDAEDIMYTDMWGSVEEFIEYMQQFERVRIPTTTTATDKKSARIYSTAELDAMDAGILPLDYSPCGQSEVQSAVGSDFEMYLGTDEDEDDDDSDANSVFMAYNGEPLPQYDGDNLPAYRSPVPSYHSQVTEYFGASASASISTIELNPEDPELPEAIIEEAELETKPRRGRLSQFRPRFVARLQRLKQKFSSSRAKRESEPGAKTPRVKEKLLQVKQDFSAKRVRTTQKLVSQLDAVSPKRAFRRARHFVTLGRC
ncbi:hypothetical protein HD806DRAFT_548809 [Xylariaceae sp. AK1471]|nr:hypothetical protein HD806DRAFT_548809 [Xylariaceae sp. AK1471]